MPPQTKVPYLLGKTRHFPIKNIKEIFNLDIFLQYTIINTGNVLTKPHDWRRWRENIFWFETIDIKQKS